MLKAKAEMYVIAFLQIIYKFVFTEMTHFNAKNGSPNESVALVGPHSSLIEWFSPVTSPTLRLYTS